MRKDRWMYIGMAGLAIYILTRKNSAAMVDSGSGGGGGISGFAAGLGEVGGALTNPVYAIQKAGEALANGITDFISGAASSGSNLILGGVNPTTANIAKSIVPGSTASASLTQNTAQQNVARFFNVPVSAVSQSVNYAKAPGVVSNYKGMTGKYDVSTGSFINQQGLGFSTIPKYAQPVTQTKSFIDPLKKKVGF